jgi:RarD protein
MIFSGIFLAVDWIGLFASYRYTTIATTTLCYYIAPVLVLLGAAIFLREKLSLRQMICIAVAVIGMGFVSGMVQNGLPKLSEMKGVLLALLGAFGYAVVILINKRYPEGDQLKPTLIQLCTAALIMTVYVLGTTDLSAYRLGAKDIGLLLLLGIVMTAAAYIAYFGLVVRIPSGSVAFFSYADPVVAVIISVFFLGEPFSIYTFIGAVMIIGAAIVAEGGFNKKQQEKGENKE